MTPLTFEMPLPANLGNSRGHWRRTYGHKKKYWALLDQMVQVRVLPQPPAVPFARARVRVEYRLYNRMDTDNLVFRWKWAGDWLTTRGYIADDRYDVLEWEAMPTQTIDRCDQGMTVTLTPINSSQEAA